MKVQNEMATRISVDTISAITSMRDFRNAVSAVTSGWRAQEQVLKSSGQYSEAVKARISGLSQVMDIQRAKIAELRSQQEGLNQENSKQRSQWLNLEKQISQANKQLAGYESQLNKAKGNSSYYTSGLAEMQRQYRLTSEASRAYVDRLRAEGKSREANQHELSGLTDSLKSLEKQQATQKKLLNEIERQSGKTSEAYKKQETQLNRTGETIANTRNRAEELKIALEPPKGVKWKFFRNQILNVDKAEEKACQTTLNFGSALKANLMGGWIQQGFSFITSQFHSIVTNGMEAAKAGAALEARWKNIGVSDNGIKELSAQVTELKTNTNLSAQAVNGLQTRFYGMTHSVSQTTTLTKGVASLADQLKLSDQQANAFAGGLSRIESSGKVTSASLGRLEKQTPGLTAAMSKASGMSQQAFKDLISSGKMTTDQFNDILTKASKDYSKNAKAFDQSAGGSMHRLRQEWTTTQAKLAKPLLKVSATGLNELSNALQNKDTQHGLQMLAKLMANAAVQAAKFIGFIAKHQSVVKTFGATILGVGVAFKTMQATVMAVDIVKRFAKLPLIIKSFKALGLAVKLATAGFNPWVIAIEAVVVAITLLYTHSKTFRKMCSEMGKLAVKAGKTIVKGFKAVVNWFKSDWKQIALFLVNPIAGGIALLYKHNKKFRGFVNGLGKVAKTGLKKVGHFFSSSSKNIQKTSSRMWKGITKTTKTAWRNQIRENQRGLKDARKTWNTMSRNVQRTSKNMWNRASRDARNGWNYVARWGNRSSKDVAKTWDWMNRQTTKAAQRMFQKHKRTFKAGYKVIEDQTKTWKDLTSGHWDRLADDTRRTANDMNKFHQRLFKDMYNKLNDMTDGRLGDMVKSWQDKMGSIGDTVANAKQAIHTHFVDLVRGIIKPFNDMLGGIQKGINWVLDKLGAPKIGGTWQVPMPSYATGTQGAHPGGFAKVNDGKTGHYRELYRLPNGVIGMFPAVRDMVVPLPKGTSILDGERSYSLMRMMGKIPHYADGVGVLSDMFSNIVNSAGDALDGMMEDVDKIMSHPIEFMESVFKKFVRVSTPVKFASDLITYVPKFIAKQMGEWIKKQFATLTNPGGAGVERWRPYIIRAFHQLGVEPVAWKVEKLLRQIATESGGNPLAFQHGYVDANTGGNEARGLLQFAGSTWAADALPGHTDWKNGYNEILAAIHVLERGGEGGWGNVGNGHGWENGGLINKHGMYEVGEYNRPEMIVPLDMSKRSRAYQLLGEIVARFHAEEPAHSAATTSTDGRRELRELNTKFDQLLGMFGQLLNLNGGQLQAIKDQGTFDVKQLYKRQARDAAMRAYS